MVPQILQDLNAAVTKAVTVMGSSKVLIDGFKGLLDAAKEEAIANGATEEELAPIADLSTALEGASDELAASVEANTTPAPAA
jgi:hypothetical protein